MEEVKVLLVCKSIHHNNTLRICNEMSSILNSIIVEPSDFKPDMINNYDLIGFGSGIYDGNHHAGIINLIESFEPQNNKPVFVFSTSTVPVKQFHKSVNELLIDKGFNIIGEFQCRGFIDYGFTKKIFGGFNKKRPNEDDLTKARIFAERIMDVYNQQR